MRGTLQRIMKLVKISLAALVALLALSSYAGDPKTDFQALYSKAAAALTKKDLSIFQTMAAKDLTYKGRDGVVLKRAELEKRLKTQFMMIKTVNKITQTVKTVKVTGGSAVVDTQTLLDATVPGAKPGKSSSLKVTSQSHDTWVKVGSLWKLKSIVVTSEAMTLDGKPMVMPSTTRQ
jgi:hypothetical protein